MCYPLTPRVECSRMDIYVFFKTDEERIQAKHFCFINNFQENHYLMNLMYFYITLTLLPLSTMT